MLTTCTVDGFNIPSKSTSFEITEIATGVSSFVETLSLTAFGASFVFDTVMKIVSFTQLAGNGNPPSQIDTTTVSVPL